MTSGLRIALCASAKTSGGGHVFAKNLIEAISRNEQVDSVTLFLHGGDGSAPMPHNVKVVNIPASRTKLLERLTRAGRLRRSVRQYELDVMIFPGTEISRAGSFLHIYWPLTVAPQEHEAVLALATTRIRRIRWWALRERIRFVSKRADATVYSSNYARNLYERQYPRLSRMPSKVIWPAPSLTDQALVAPNSNRRPAQILFVSHLYPYKKAVEMVIAFGMAVKTGLIDSELVIAGNPADSEYYELLKHAIDSTGIRDQIMVLGNVDQDKLKSLYQSADLFLFPSISENAGSFALIDAFRYGVPVMSSDRSSMPEMCGSSAIYFNPTNPTALSRLLVEFFNSEEMQKEYAVRSRKQFENYPTWEQISDSLVEFLSQLKRG